MAGSCECNIAAMFPIISGRGIISANLRSNTQIMITSDKQILIGATIAELAITGYGEKETFTCPGQAGVSYEWIQKYDCSADKIYFVPRGGEKAFKEGAVATSITMMSAGVTSKGFSASASSGPHTVYLSSSQEVGYDFLYNGSPISVTGRDTSAGSISDLLPNGTAYLTNFRWEQTPPNIPTVSYSFIFAGR